MQDNKNRLTGAEALYRLATSPYIHIAMTFGILAQIATDFSFNSAEAPIGAFLLFFIGVVAISGLWYDDPYQRGLRFYRATFLSWVVALTFVVSPMGQWAFISVSIVALLSLFVDRFQTVLATFGIVAAVEMGWLFQVDSYELSDLRVPLFHIAVVVVYTVLIYYVFGVGHEREYKRKPTGERQKLMALVNSMADGVIATDHEQKVTFYNGAALDVLNINVSLEGQKINQYLNLVDQKDNPVDIFDLAHKSRTAYVTRDLRLRFEDDSPINLYLSIAPVNMGYGQESTLGYIILLRDITKEKTLEEERDEFISVVSHELRTPVTVAEGAISNAQLIIEKDDKKALETSLKEAHKSAVFLADMINDLSMLARAERGKLQVDPESVDIVKLVKELQEDYQVEAKSKGLEVKLGKMDDDIKPVNTSPLYVKEILQNFITNSMKYTEKGSITLTAVHTDKGVDVSVKDTGIGISKSDQKKLFDKFFRSEDYRTRTRSGTGLGLYVTMKLTHLIGASINVESKLNEGSNFTISIPNLEAHHHRKRNN